MSTIGATSLEHLRALAIWVPVKIVPKRGKPGAPSGKTDKVPVNAGGYNIDAQNPANCMSWWESDAIRQTLPGDTGVGLVMHPGSGLFCVDLDDCIGSAGLTELALGIIEALPGVLMERSHSGRGLHLWGYATVPEHRTRSDRVPGLEVYTTGRFILVTDDILAGWMDDHSATLEALTTALFGTQAPPVQFDWTDTGLYDDVPDDAVIARVRSHRIGGEGKCGQILWDGDVDQLGRYYPSSTGAEYDGSATDLALATLLMTYTGNNAERSARMLLDSGLARDKHHRDEYVRWTIERAYRPDMRPAIRPELLPWTGKVPSIPVIVAPEAPTPTDALPAVAPELQPLPPEYAVPEWPPGHYLQAADMAQHFAGCVYVTDRDQIYVPDGRTLTERQFNNTFGGRGWSFQSTRDNKITRKAWDACINGEVWTCPRADGVHFDPSRTPGEIIKRCVNTWLPPRVRAVAGDASPYIDLLERQIPDERDRRILLSWMAACVQHPDKKFRWSPYIQGIKGNGKTTHFDVLEYCIGVDYTCRPSADKMGKQFNAIFDRKLLVCVDDINMAGHNALWDKLKPMVTGGVMEIEHKGVNSSMVRDMRNKYIFTSNEQAGLPVTSDERRLAPFFTAQQEDEDLARDGMDGDYFVRFHGWLDIDAGGKGEGAAIVAHYLLHYPIDPEFDPAAKCQRAPWTTSTQEAINKSRAGIERHVADAIQTTRELGATGTIRLSEVQIFYRKHNARLPDIAEVTDLLRVFRFRRGDDEAGPLWRRPAM